MSWWGKLGKIVAGIAAPFTGGWSLAAIPALGAAEGAANGGGWKGALAGAAGGGLQAFGGTGFGGGDFGRDPGMSFPSSAPGWLQLLQQNGASNDQLSMLADAGKKDPSIWQRIGGILTGSGLGGKIMGTAGDVASGIEKGRASERAGENEFNMGQDRNKIVASQNYEQGLENRAALEMKQQQAGQEYQGSAYRQALLGALGKNLQDVSLGGVPSDVPVVSFGGGLRPSAIGPEGRAAAALLNQKAMANLQAGMHNTPLPELEKFTPSDYKKGNWVDTILGGIGTAGKAGDIWNQRTQAGKDADWIQKIRDEIEGKQKGTQVPTGVPSDAVMRDANGNPVYPDQGDNTNPWGAKQPTAATPPPGADPLTWLKLMNAAGG
jgi:hypothetical protein